MKTYTAKKEEIQRQWYLVDAKDKILGRLASEVAKVLIGKHKPIFTPYVDTGDYVIIINADKIKVTGQKMHMKEYQEYSGYHGGQKSIKLEELLIKAPTKVLRKAVNRMIPKGSLGNKVKKKLRIY